MLSRGIVYVIGAGIGAVAGLGIQAFTDWPRSFVVGVACVAGSLSLGLAERRGWVQIPSLWSKPTSLTQ